MNLTISCTHLSKSARFFYVGNPYGLCFGRKGHRDKFSQYYTDFWGKKRRNFCTLIFSAVDSIILVHNVVCRIPTVTNDSQNDTDITHQNQNNNYLLRFFLSRFLSVTLVSSLLRNSSSSELFRSAFWCSRSTSSAQFWKVKNSFQHSATY